MALGNRQERAKNEGDEGICNLKLVKFIKVTGDCPGLNYLFLILIVILSKFEAFCSE